MDKIEITSVDTPVVSKGDINASCRLLNLPQELKNQIYSHLCTGQLIHVHSRASTKFRADKIYRIRYHVCTLNDFHTCAGEVVSIYSKSAESKVWHQHSDCLRKALNIFPNKIPYYCDWCILSPPVCTTEAANVLRDASSPIDLSFIRTCKQMYEEAKVMPYTTNTFSFSDYRVLGRFISEYPNALHFRRLKLCIYIDRGRWKETWPLWQSSLRTLSLQVKTLRHLSVTIDVRFHRDVAGSSPPSMVLEKEKGDDIGNALAQLAPTLTLPDVIDAMKDRSLGRLPKPLGGLWLLVDEWGGSKSRGLGVGTMRSLSLGNDTGISRDCTHKIILFSQGCLYHPSSISDNSHGDELSLSMNRPGGSNDQISQVVVGRLIHHLLRFW